MQGMIAVQMHQQFGQSLFTGLDHWTGLLDWITGLTFDPQIPTKMSIFSAVDNPRLQLCPLLCQYILSNRLSSQIGPSKLICFQLQPSIFNT